MKLHFEEENLSKKQECSAPTSNLEGTAPNSVMAKGVGSGVQGHQATLKLEKRLKFLDDLELLRRRSNPDERISERKFVISSKFMDGVKKNKLKTIIATHFTLSADSVPKPDDLRIKSRE